MTYPDGTPDPQGQHRMTPTDEWDGVRLYRGDALDVLPTLSPISVVITDPPYVVKEAVQLRSPGVAPRKQVSTTIGDQGWTLGKEWIGLAAKLKPNHMIIFGNYLDLPEILVDRGQGELRGIITWRKPNAPLPVWNVPRFDTEFAVWFGRGKNPKNIKRLDSMVIDCPFPPAGCMATERILDGTGAALHPAQKPLKVMRRIVEAFTVPGERVIDPFMGTGTTGVAVLRAGCSFIGIERDPGHYATALARLRHASGTAPDQLFSVLGDS